MDCVKHVLHVESLSHKRESVSPGDKPCPRLCRLSFGALGCMSEAQYRPLQLKKTAKKQMFCQRKDIVKVVPNLQRRFSTTASDKRGRHKLIRYNFKPWNYYSKMTAVRNSMVNVGNK